jgi:hypothetical protein
VVAGGNGGVGDVLRDHRFAEALGRDGDDVARAGEEVELQHRLDGDSSKKARALWSDFHFVIDFNL